jgi:hypothetical protein
MPIPTGIPIDGIVPQPDRQMIVGASSAELDYTTSRDIYLEPSKPLQSAQKQREQKVFWSFLTKSKVLDKWFLLVW